MMRFEREHRGVVARWKKYALALAAGLIPLAAAATAGAHIILVPDGGADTPKDWLVMTDSLGDPQKPTPCGGAGTPTNIVTTFQAGQTVTLTWVEVIAHSGHFRIAFAPVSPAEATATTLPDPVVTAYTSSADTEASAVAVTPTGGSISSSGIVLADNLFPHCIHGDPCAAGVPVTGAPKTYSTTVTLPTTACTNCTLQLVQFMSYHPIDPSFFYHHCAAVTIVAAATGGDASGHDAGVQTTHDAGDHGGKDSGAVKSSGAGSSMSDAAAVSGPPPAPDGGVTPKGSGSSGCSVASQGEASGAAGWLAAVLVVGMGRRRRYRR